MADDKMNPSAKPTTTTTIDKIPLSSDFLKLLRLSDVALQDIENTADSSNDQLIVFAPTTSLYGIDNLSQEEAKKTLNIHLSLDGKSDSNGNCLLKLYDSNGNLTSVNGESVSDILSLKTKNNNEFKVVFINNILKSGYNIPDDNGICPGT